MWYWSHHPLPKVSGAKFDFDDKWHMFLTALASPSRGVQIPSSCPIIYSKNTTFYPLGSDAHLSVPVNVFVFCVIFTAYEGLALSGLYSSGMCFKGPLLTLPLTLAPKTACPHARHSLPLAKAARLSNSRSGSQEPPTPPMHPFLLPCIRSLCVSLHGFLVKAARLSNSRSGSQEPPTSPMHPFLLPYTRSLCVSLHGFICEVPGQNLAGCVLLTCVIEAVS